MNIILKKKLSTGLVLVKCRSISVENRYSYTRKSKWIEEIYYNLKNRKLTDIDEVHAKMVNECAELVFIIFYEYVNILV